MADELTQCLSTTVRNVDPADIAVYYGFLGPRGATLQPGQEFTVLGGFESLLSLGINGVTGDIIRREAFRAAVDAGSLAIVRTPAPHSYDPVLNLTRMITIVNGVPIVEDPCWGNFSSVG